MENTTSSPTTDIGDSVVTDAPDVSTYTEGSAEPVSNGQNHGSEREFDSLQGWKEQRKKDREAFSEFAEDKAEAPAEEPKTAPAELERPAVNGADDGGLTNDEYADLFASLKAALPPDKAEHAIARLDEALRVGKTRSAELTVRGKVMEFAHAQSMATLQANSNMLNLADHNAHRYFEQTYGVPMSFEAIQQLYATNPEMATAALQAKAAHDAEMSVMREHYAQQEQLAQANDLAMAEAGDNQLIEHLRATEPGVLDDNGRIKSEFPVMTVKYLVNDMGLSQSEIRHMHSTNAKISFRDGRFQKMMLDAARYRDAKAKASEAVKKAVPEVVRPGQPGGSAPFGDAAEIARLEGKGALSQREGARLIGLKMRRSRG
jgi:hypothetical protein